MKQASGPSAFRLLVELPSLKRDLLGRLVDWRARYGDVIRVPLTRPPLYQLSHPDDIKHVLATNALNYDKGGGLARADLVLGKGLLTSQEPLHTRQRRIMQPAFHRQQINSFVQLMCDVADERLAQWKDGQVLDVPSEMTRLTVAIIGRAMLGSDLSDGANLIGETLRICMKYLQGDSVFHPPDWLQPARRRAYRAAVARIDELIYGLIARRKAMVERPDDLVTLLLEARLDDGSHVGDKQVRDELVNIFLAGHETTSNLLTWMFYLLSRHPDVAQRMRNEIESLFGAEPPRASDLEKLRYTASVIAETLRLYPPVWIVARRALEADTLPTGVRIPKGAELVVVVYAVHRNPRYFPEPERFDPDRFYRPPGDGVPAYTYLPFGAGRRGCIGESFARAEAVVLTAMIMQRFTLHADRGQQVVPEPLLTLRPRGGLSMRVEVRPR